MYDLSYFVWDFFLNGYIFQKNVFLNQSLGFLDIVYFFENLF